MPRQAFLLQQRTLLLAAREIPKFSLAMTMDDNHLLPATGKSGRAPHSAHEPS
jgi:hypothetical protein